MCSLVHNNNPPAVKSPVEEMLRYIDSLPEEPPKAREEIRTRKFWTAIWSEFVATLLLIVVTSTAEKDSDIRQGLTVGATAALLSYTLHGAAFNPAVTLARCLVGHASMLKLFVSVVVQVLGAGLGALLVLALKSSPPGSLAGSETKLNLSQIFGIEFLGSLIVVLTVLTSDDDVESGLLKVQAVPVGIAYGATALFSFSQTGVGLNPARALGPALLSREWTNHWMYWLGPLLGGLIGCFTYDYAKSSRKEVHDRSRRSLRQRERERAIRRDLSALSQDTEMTNSVNTNDCRV